MPSSSKALGSIILTMTYSNSTWNIILNMTSFSNCTWNIILKLTSFSNNTWNTILKMTSNTNSTTLYTVRLELYSSIDNHTLWIEEFF